MQEPSFSAWTVVFVISAAQGLLLALVFGFSKYKPNKLLAAILLLFALTMTEYVLFWTGYMKKFIHWANISLGFPFLFGPLLWWYFRLVFDQRTIQLKWGGLHLIPFLVCVGIYMPYYTLPGWVKINVMSGAAFSPVPSWQSLVCIWGSIVHLLSYTIWNYIYLLRQPHVGQSKGWAYWLNTFMLGYALAYTSYYILIRFDFFDRNWDYHISLAMTLFIYLIAIAGYIRPAVFQGYKILETAPVTKYRNSGLTDAAIQSLFGRLAQVMETEQLYRNPDLNLDTLSQRLNASKHHVSQVINACTDGTFFDYINGLRIEEAQKLLAEHNRSALNVIEVAYAVGFNNKVSFNTAFKKATGITPTVFRQQHARTDHTIQAPGKSSQGS
ncbi:MAG: helix-turn-helix transcriptional regulator [Saprospiraceae bacterium]|nr:helix-turn-helix transcriptional regulator [Saprospiraceae bacterium]